MENSIMKIMRLEINKLHGYSDYAINFNNDVTFLYGENGCGKTTILNIITYIITGRIYELFSFKFEKISLFFYSTQLNSIEKLTITSLGESLKVEFFNEEELVHHNIEFMYKYGEDKEEKDRFYFSEYPLLYKIKKTFNYVYLPLNRNGNIGGIDNNLNRIPQARFASKHRSVQGIDDSLREVENLVRGAYNKVNFILNHISERFSDELLKSFLDVDNILTFEKVVEYMQKLNETDIRSLQQEYTDVLKNMNRWGQETEDKINSFFDSLVNDINTDINNSEFELLFKISELSKISTVISKAQKSEQDKKKHKQPIDDFIKTVNLFISGKKIKKEICIDTDGTVYLKTANVKKVDIYHLSSGEKQIVTFFAYLIFGLEKTKQSIFIVDEPELSLHLDWQRQFVDSIMKISPNVQLIFATHAPEMIGRHREKAVKLMPNV